MHSQPPFHDDKLSAGSALAPFIAACVQAAPVNFDTAKTLEKVRGWVSLSDDPDAIVCRGGACIVSPLGKLLAGPLWDKERILTAEIDLGEIPKAQYDFDPVGHYSRPDVFKLSVNRTAMAPVHYEPGI